MDSSRFDALTRVFARRASRRAVAGAVAALVPLAAVAAPEPAACLATGKRCRLAAQDARHGRGKGKGKGGKGKHHPPSCDKCCSRYGTAGPDGKARCTCKSEGIACDTPSQCCSGQCRNNMCTACPPTTVFCPDGCADLQTDQQHCGSCETACDAGQRCQDGTCVCDEQSCSFGCCDGDTCKRGTADDACGEGGTACQNCAADAAVCRSGACCTPNDPCAGTCGATLENSCGQSVACPCTVFASSARYNGNMGGLTGADAKCQALATAAGLDGTYFAWLSDDDGSPASRFTQSQTPYQLVDGTVVAADWTALTSGALQHAIDLNESGGQLSANSTVWTDTKPDGTIDSSENDCGAWLRGDPNVKSSLGLVSRTDGGWTQDGIADCDSTEHLYCFQQKGVG